MQVPASPPTLEPAKREKNAGPTNHSGLCRPGQVPTPSPRRGLLDVLKRGRLHPARGSCGWPAAGQQAATSPTGGDMAAAGGERLLQKGRQRSLRRLVRHFGSTVASHIPVNKRRSRNVTRIWRRSSPDVQKTRRRDACRPEPSARFGVGALLRTRSVSKRRRRIFGALAAVAVLLIGVLILFDWNWLKGPIESQVSERLGRPFRIHGDLDVKLSLQPKITVERAELGNAPWGSDAPMAKIDRVEAQVDLLKLVQGEIVLPELRIAQPDLLLETRPDGPPNWQFGEAKETTARAAGPAADRSAGGQRCLDSLPRSRQRTERHRRAPAHRGPHRPRPEAERDVERCKESRSISRSPVRRLPSSRTAPSPIRHRSPSSSARATSTAI